MVYGVGYNSGGKFMKSVNRKRSKSESVWKDMIRRCHSPLYQSQNETYKGCEVYEPWLDFQVFAEWFHNNHVDGYQLDKDILGNGKLYSPDTCVFIPKALNLLLVNISASKSRNNHLPLGVTLGKNGTSFIAYCNNGEGKTINLGSRNNKEDAFSLYKGYKESLIQRKANEYFNSGVIVGKVRDALLMYEVKPYI